MWTKERFAPVALLSSATSANRSRSLFCKEWWERWKRWERREQFAQVALLKKSEWAKSDGRDSLLGIKKGKTVKNIRKIRIFRAIFFSFFASESLTVHRFYIFERSNRNIWIPYFKIVVLKMRYLPKNSGCYFSEVIL